MRIDITELFNTRDAAMPFDFSEAHGSLEMYGEEFTFMTPVRLKGNIRLADTEFVVTGQLTAGYTARCGRCGEALEAELSIGVDEVFARVADEDSDTYLFQGDAIDFSEMLETLLALNIPMKHLCREDCRGICPVCGANLNNTECGHNAAEETSPFGALSALKTGDYEEE